MEYAPQPPFNSGTPATAPQAILTAARDKLAPLRAARLETAKKVAKSLGVNVNQ